MCKFLISDKEEDFRQVSLQTRHRGRAGQLLLVRAPSLPPLSTGLRCAMGHPTVAVSHSAPPPGFHAVQLQGSIQPRQTDPQPSNPHPTHVPGLLLLCPGHVTWHSSLPWSLCESAKQPERNPEVIFLDKPFHNTASTLGNFDATLRKKYSSLTLWNPPTHNMTTCYKPSP